MRPFLFMPIKKNNWKRKTDKFVRRVNSITPDVLIEVLSKGMQESNARTPKDTSALVNSAFKEIKQRGTGEWIGIAGYATEYAMNVHWMKGKLKGKNRPDLAHRKNRGKYWGPNGEPEWLYKSFTVYASDEIHAIIKKAYKVKNIR